MLAGHSRDALHGRQDVQFLALGTNSKNLLLHIGVLCLQYEAAYLEVREAQNLGLAQYLGRNLLQCVVFRKLVLVVYYILHALDEPRVDLGQLLDALDGVAFLQSLGDGEDTEVGRIGKLLVQVVELGVVVAYETVHSLTDHAQTLLEHLLERAADRHDFTYRLHRRTDLAAYTGKLGKVPTGNLADHIVE